MSLSNNFYLKQRLEKLRSLLDSSKLDSILISNTANRFYLTGWLGDSESGFLLISKKNAYIITDSRYTEEVSKKVTDFELKEYGQSEDFWVKLFKEAKIKKVGFEAKDFSVFTLKKYRTLTKGVSWLGTVDLIEKLRSQKDSSEIDMIKRSVAIADQSFEYILKNIRVGQTEREVAFEIEKFMRSKGSEKNAWESFIVGSGTNSSMVHYSAGDKKIKSGDQVLIDWGCYRLGYACDISRVVFMGNPSSKQAKIYNLVLKAQNLAIAKISVGQLTQTVDLVARNFLRLQTPYFFRHAIGHGVGLEVHELPHVNEKTKDRFQIGNVITVEPGIYEPGFGGVRIEDMFLINNTSLVALTKAPKSLNQVIV